MKVVKDCINITRSFCDLTDVWVNRTDMYVSQVVGYRENTAVARVGRGTPEPCTGRAYLRKGCI